MSEILFGRVKRTSSKFSIVKVEGRKREIILFPNRMCEAKPHKSGIGVFLGEIGWNTSFFSNPKVNDEVALIIHAMSDPKKPCDLAWHWLLADRYCQVANDSIEKKIFRVTGTCASEDREREINQGPIVDIINRVQWNMWENVHWFFKDGRRWKLCRDPRPFFTGVNDEINGSQSVRDNGNGNGINGAKVNVGANNGHNGNNESGATGSPGNKIAGFTAEKRVRVIEEEGLTAQSEYRKLVHATSGKNHGKSRRRGRRRTVETVNSA